MAASKRFELLCRISDHHLSRMRPSASQATRYKYTMTLYDELELSPSCSMEDIKQQYRTLASVHHPDKGGDEERFKRIKFSYEVLSDSARRKQYDETKTTNEKCQSIFCAVSIQ